jgi:hypothetical protein
MYRYFGDEVMMHLKFIRVVGNVIPAALQLVQYTTQERLNQIMRYHEEQGVFIANPHTYIIEEGGRKVIYPEQMQFKAMVDLYDLLNPGKIKAHKSGYWLERGQGELRITNYELYRWFLWRRRRTNPPHFPQLSCHHWAIATD